MENKKKLEHAKKWGYAVSVYWEKPKPQIAKGVVSEIMLNGFKLQDNKWKYDYAYIISVEPSEPEVVKPGIPAVMDELAAEYEHVLNEIQTSLAFLKKAQEKFGDVDPISIADARRVIREAFERDPDCKRAYIVNIAMKLMDRLHTKAGIRDEVSEEILDMIFSE